MTRKSLADRYYVHRRSVLVLVNPKYLPPGWLMTCNGITWHSAILGTRACMWSAGRGNFRCHWKRRVRACWFHYLYNGFRRNFQSSQRVRKTIMSHSQSISSLFQPVVEDFLLGGNTNDWKRNETCQKFTKMSNSRKTTLIITWQFARSLVNEQGCKMLSMITVLEMSAPRFILIYYTVW